MCYSGKCCHCLQVETGALIFGILNVMYTACGTVISLGGCAYTAFATQIAVENERDERVIPVMLAAGLTSNIAFGILTVAFAISLSFAIVLLVGICKRKANLVKCYFVYGVMKLVFGVAGMLIIIIQLNATPAILLLAIAGVTYGLLLLMIRHTYMKFQAEVPFHSFTNPMSTVEKF